MWPAGLLTWGAASFGRVLLVGLLPNGMLAIATGIGMLIIVRGIVVDAPSGVFEAINRNNARLLRLFGRPVTA